MLSDINKSLLSLGLNDKEAKVYTSLLELGVVTANKIAKETGINRSSVYVVIESLRKKGLITLSSADKNIQSYIAVSPSTLLDMAKEMSQKSIDTQKKIEEVLPKLKNLHKKTEHIPQVLIYEGDEATKMSYYQAFGSEFRIFKDLTGMKDVVPTDYVKKDAIRRRKQKIKMFMISPDTPENREVVETYKTNKSPDKFILIPKNKFSKSKTSKNIGIGIFKDRVKFASGKDKFAIYIINQPIVDTLRDLFDLAWEGWRGKDEK